ncbi:hypothetical protein [Ramlibacter sp.]|uniref:hypothetical protein n=1 Tax=Ramlibacter sp. TaxID=1917967 RepID=UPI002FC94795
MTAAFRLARRLARRRPIRPLVQGLAAAAVLCMAGPAGSVVTTTCCYGGTRDVTLRVGTATAGVIDVVRFDVGGTPLGNAQAAVPNPHGSGVPVAAAGGTVPIYLRVRVPPSRLPQQISVTVSSPVALTCAAGCGTIPFSQISWTVTNPAAGDFIDGTLGGTSTILGPVTFTGFNGGADGGTYLVTNNLSFSFANATAYAAGRYTGRVTYTVTLP